MLPRFLRFFAAFLLLFTLSLPFAVGQSDTTIERGVKLDPTASEKSTASPSVFPYFVLTIYTLLVMTIVCMPTRKA